MLNPPSSPVKFRLPRLFWALIFWSLLPLSSANGAGANPDLYRTEDLPRYVQDLAVGIRKLESEQAERKKEIVSLDAEIAKYRQRTGGNTKKNPEAAQAIADAQRRKKVLEQKIAYYTPQVSQKKASYQTLIGIQKQRQGELQLFPKGNPSTWTPALAKKAITLYAIWIKRGRVQLAYYQKQYSESAATMQESARRQNFLNQLQTELRDMERKYNSLQNIQSQLEYEEEQSRQEKQAALRESEAVRNQPTVAPTPKPVPTPRPTFVPVPTPEPIPEPPKDFFTKFNEFNEDHLWVTLLVLLLAMSVSYFLGLQLSDRNNSRHTPLAAVALGAGTAICFAIPVFGVILGVIAIALAFTIYYQLSMEALAKTLPIFFVILLATGALSSAVLWFTLK